nr:head GIN domain-containing protein [Pedobacter panaciterrae]
MKKTFLFASLLCMVGFNAISKNTISALPVFTKVDVPSSDERTVKNFTGVAAGGPINVVIKMGSTESLKFEGDAEAISTLISEVKGNILVIRPKNSWTSWAKKYEGKTITAYVTAKDITSLTMSGNGSIIVNGELTSGEFTSTLSGSGSIKANINVDKLTGVISGSGNLNISGKTDAVQITISGSGNLNGKTLITNRLSTRISGSGTVSIKTDGTIKAFISGSGNVYYSGNPTIEKTVIGSGGVSEL